MIDMPKTSSTSITYWKSITHSASDIQTLSHWSQDKIASIGRWHFKHVFFNENVAIEIEISFKFVPKCQKDNNPALVQLMAWHHIGDKPLSEPMMGQFTDAYSSLSLDEIFLSQAIFQTYTICSMVSQTMEIWIIYWVQDLTDGYKLPTIYIKRNGQIHNWSTQFLLYMTLLNSSHPAVHVDA